jgi:hypothetical protein
MAGAAEDCVFCAISGATSWQTRVAPAARARIFYAVDAKTGAIQDRSESELAAAARIRRRRDLELTMDQRLERLNSLCKQVAELGASSPPAAPRRS